MADGPALPAVDVAVVSFRSAADLPGFVAAVARQEGRAAPPRILLADNAPGDGSAEAAAAAARQAGVRLEVIPSPRNLGFGAAANRAIARATSEWVLLLNPDGAPAPGCLRELFAVARAGPGAAMVEARQVPFEHPKVYDPVTLETSWSSAAAVLLRREAFLRAGGFDEALFLYAEDVDLSWRLRAAGGRCLYAPRAVFHHRSGERVRGESPLASRYATLHDLYLRWRYGSPAQILAGYLRFLRLLARAAGDGPLRRGLLSVARSHPRMIPLALRGRGALRRAGVGRFSGGEYEFPREGAACPFEPPSRTPRVSIVVRTFRRPGFLREALACLARQTYPDVEVVVAEDGSTDGEAVVREFEGRMPVRYLRAPPGSGRSRTGNLGVRASSGTLVGLLDDDDLLFADHVEALVAALEKGRARVAYALGIEAEQLLEGEDPLRYRILRRAIPWNQPFDRPILFHHNYIPLPCALFERSLFEEAGGFDEGLPVLEDWDLWLRFSRVVTSFAFLPRATCEYRRRRSTRGDAARDRERQAGMDAAYAGVLAKYGARPGPDPGSRKPPWDRRLRELARAPGRRVLRLLEGR